MIDDGDVPCCALLGRLFADTLMRTAANEACAITAILDCVLT